MDSSKPTLFVDIDGSIVEYNPECFSGRADMKLLPGTLEKMTEWRKKGYRIILTTGRGLSQLETERQLKTAGIPYDHLIMGLGGGPRHLINDIKPDGTLTAIAHNLPRNQGIASVQI